MSLELPFGPGKTFIAKSSFHGPTGGYDVEIEPVNGFHPSNWTGNGENGSNLWTDYLKFATVVKLLIKVFFFFH